MKNKELGTALSIGDVVTHRLNGRRGIVTDVGEGFLVRVEFNGHSKWERRPEVLDARLLNMYKAEPNDFVKVLVFLFFAAPWIVGVVSAVVWLVG